MTWRPCSSLALVSPANRYLNKGRDDIERPGRESPENDGQVSLEEDR